MLPSRSLTGSAGAEACGWSTTWTRAPSLGPDAPCLTTDGVDPVLRARCRSSSLPHRGGPGRARRPARRPGRDPVGQRPDRVHAACSASAGPARCGARSTRATRPRENRELLDLFDCTVLIFQAGVRAAGGPRSAPTCRSCTRWCASTATCRSARLGRSSSAGRATAESTDAGRRRPRDDRRHRRHDGPPQGRELTGRNLETMTAITLMGYPFDGRPVYLALAPLTHAAGVLCFPVLALGGEIVIMRDARRRRVPRAGRAAPGHAHVPAADADLHGARPPGLDADGPLVAAVLLVRRGADVGGPAGGGARRGSAR